MLTSGMVPALYADDEKEAILSGVIIYMSHIFTCYQHLVSWSFFFINTPAVPAPLESPIMLLELQTQLKTEMRKSKLFLLH
jgi:hypothetical protein